MQEKLQKTLTSIINLLRNPYYVVDDFDAERAKAVFALIDRWPTKSGELHQIPALLKEYARTLESQVTVCPACRELIRKNNLDVHQKRCTHFKKIGKVAPQRIILFNGTTYTETEFLHYLETLRHVNPQLYKACKASYF